MSARGVDCSNQFRQRHALEMSDFFELIPESTFEGNAGFVSIKHDGTFGHDRFHGTPIWPPYPALLLQAISEIAFKLDTLCMAGKSSWIKVEYHLRANGHVR